MPRKQPESAKSSRRAFTKEFKEEAVQMLLDSINSRGNDGENLEHQISVLLRLIYHTVGDQKLSPTLAWHAAKAVDDGRLPRPDLDNLLTRIEDMRDAGVLRKPGAYFVASMQYLAKVYGIPELEKLQ